MILILYYYRIGKGVLRLKEIKGDIVRAFIFKEIKARRIKTGQRLPSCRELSARLGVNKITVNKAYHQLERENVVYSIPRGGFYLLEENTDKAATMGGKVDFSSVKPDEGLIPYREFTHVMNRAIDLHQRSIFNYEAVGGLASLRETLKYEFMKEGVYTNTEQIVITHGAQQAIHLALQAIFKGRKGKLLVEVPTYSLALRLVDHLGIGVVGIERKKEGFDFQALEKILASDEILAFYVIPRHHNPTGFTLAEGDKQKLAALSVKYNVTIIEDDYLADLGSKKGILPIHYYDTSENTVYIRSFSKTFMPGIRMGAAVLPKDMVAAVLDLKHSIDLNTSRLPQAALDLFIKSGMYDKHIKRIRGLYEAKLKQAAEIMKSLDTEGLFYHVPKHGIFIWLRLPEDINALELETALAYRGILIKTASEFFPVEYREECKANRCVRLCVLGVKKENIKALASIISVIKSLRDGKRLYKQV